MLGPNKATRLVTTRQSASPAFRAAPANALGARAAREAQRLLSLLEDDAQSVGRSMAVETAREVAAIGQVAVQDPSFLDGWFSGWCAQHVATLVRKARREGGLLDEELDFVREVGAIRAADAFPLEALLHGLRVGHRVLWKRMVREAELSPSGVEAVVWLTAQSLDYVDAVSMAMGGAYLERQAVLQADAERARRDLLEEVLAGQFAGRPDAAARAAAFGFEPDARQLVVALAAATAAGGAARSGPSPALIAATLERLIRPSCREPFVVVRDDEAVGVLPAKHDPVPTLQAVGKELAAQAGIVLAVGISLPCRGLAEVPRGYEEAFQALRSARAGGGIADLRATRIFDHLTAHADRVAPRLIPERVRAAIGDGAEESSLVATLEAYLAEDLNVPRAAARLYVHPNTVRYRLARLEELTGRDTRAFWDLVELVTAVRVLASRD
jgi:PucR C-terminal helix-turn-helix domain/GGDEF-like domain